LFEIGNSLREARVRRGIELPQAEQATKIRSKYLRALEEEHFELLPAETYVKGFLRTYADYLGLDGQLYVDEFNSRFVTDDRELRARRSSRPNRRSRRAETIVVLAVLSAITLVTVVVVGAWKSSGGDSANQAAKPAAKPKVVRPAAPYLILRAVGGSSHVAVHRGDAAGAVVYEGTLVKGQRLPFKGKRYWLDLSSPEHLVITVGGKRVTIPGKRPRVLTVSPAGWQVA
jgi:hypothetical protein